MTKHKSLGNCPTKSTKHKICVFCPLEFVHKCSTNNKTQNLSTDFEKCSTNFVEQTQMGNKMMNSVMEYLYLFNKFVNKFVEQKTQRTNSGILNFYLLNNFKFVEQIKFVEQKTQKSN